MVSVLICAAGWQQWMASGEYWALWFRGSVCWSSLQWATSAACGSDEETHWCTVCCHQSRIICI